MKNLFKLGVCVTVNIIFLTSCKSDNALLTKHFDNEPDYVESTESLSEKSNYSSEISLTDVSSNDSDVSYSYDDISDEYVKNDLTFEDLSKYNYHFCSGAGAWGEEFNIEKDGYFWGVFYDADAGCTGEGYDNGTYYSSSYSGHLSNLTKINDYTYELTLSDISYDHTPDTSEILDDTLYCYTTSYCFGSNDTFKVYLPGTPLSELSDEVIMWISSAYDYDSDTELNGIIIVDEENNYGIYTTDRDTPLEDAQSTYDSYKYSYDYYMDTLSNASTTLEMSDNAEELYKLSDTCLNKIWIFIKYNVDDVTFEQIYSEQKNWIAERDAKESELSTNDVSSPDINMALAEMTMDRCEELIDYLR